MRGWTVHDSLELYSVAVWGAGFFTVNEARPRRGAPARRRRPEIDLLELVQDLEQRGLRTPLLIRFSDILAARVAGHRQGFEQRDRRVRLQGPLPRRLPDQGEPAAPRGRGDRPVRRAATASASRRAPSPSCWSALALLDTPEALIICNGYKDRDYIETALLAQKLGRTPIIVIDRFRRARPGDQDLARARHPPAHRRARAALDPRRRQVDGVGRRPLQVRALGAGDRRGGRPAARRGHARLPRAAALPHRLADHRDPRPQGRAGRGEPRLRRAARARRAAARARRRRRPRRRLRRLAAPTSTPR